jgi:hypothetical protein
VLGIAALHPSYEKAPEISLRDFSLRVLRASAISLGRDAP